MMKTGVPKSGDKKEILPPSKADELESSLSSVSSFSRDDSSIYKFGPHVMVNFVDVFEEGQDYQSSKMGENIGEKVNHGCLKSTFDSCNSGVFYVLSAIFGWISVLVCGCIYGVNAAVQIWVVQPVIKLLFTWFRLCFACNRACVRACCDPCCQSLGQSLAYIRGRFRTDLTGLNVTNSTSTYNYGATADAEDK